MEKHDILIIGGSVAGMALACSLAETGLSIAVLERQMPDMHWPREDFALRVSAIAPSSQKLFEHTNVWERIKALRISPYERMYVWDSTGTGEIEFNCKEISKPELGNIIENCVLQKALHERIESLSNVKYLCPVEIKDLQLEEEGGRVQLGNEQWLQANLVVAADGANSWVRKHLKIDVSEKDYDHHAIVANVICEKPHEKAARQVFHGKGVLAFLPMSEEKTCSIVWSVEPDLAKSILDLDDDAFKRKLAATFQHKLGDITQTSKRASFPLRKRHVDTYIKPHLALVGDAAHTVHPLAGLGLNMALADVGCLSEKIKNAIENKKDYASVDVLRKYERERKSENFKVLATMDGFRHLFGSDFLPTILLRNFGLNLTNKIKPLKNFFAQSAMKVAD